MSKKMKKKNKKEQVVSTEFTLEGIANENDKVVVVEDELAAKEVLLSGMIENLVDETITKLISNGFRERELLLFREDMHEISRKAFMGEIQKDEAQKEIARLIIDKLAPNTRVYTNDDINEMVKLGTKLTPKKFNKFGIKKKELKNKIGEYCAYLSEEHGLIKERLTNTLYKFFRDNWSVFNKEFDEEFRKVLKAASEENFKETKDARIEAFIKSIDKVKSEDVFKYAKDLKKKCSIRRTNPELEVKKDEAKVEAKQNKVTELRRHLKTASDIVKMMNEASEENRKRFAVAIRRLG